MNNSSLLNTIVLLTSILVHQVSYGEVQTLDKTNRESPVSKKIYVTDKEAILTGPVGLGALKIGISKEAVLNLKQIDGVYLTQPLTDFVFKSYTPKSDENIYETKIQLPDETEPTEVTLTFLNNILHSIFMNLKSKPILFNKLKIIVSEKYNKGIEKNDLKEKLCIFKNGNNFKIKSGSILTTWNHKQIITNKIIETSFLYYDIQLCYSALDETRINSESMSISIRLIDEKIENNKKSIF